MILCLMPYLKTKEALDAIVAQRVLMKKAMQLDYKEWRKLILIWTLFHKVKQELFATKVRMQHML